MRKLTSKMLYPAETRFILYSFYLPRSIAFYRQTHGATYLGPLTRVTDDFGHTYQRGEPVALNVHDWPTLFRSAAAISFSSLGLREK